MSEPNNRARRLWGSVALLLVGALIASSDAIGAGRTLLFGDHLPVFRPKFFEIVRAFSEGSLPALTRASPGGVPLEALLNSTYTPATLLLFLGDFETTYDLFVLAHIPILIFGGFLLARRLGWSPYYAASAAATAGLCGWCLGFNTLLLAFPCLAYAPWMYWAFHRLLEDASPRNVGLQALAIGFHAQGILPEVALLDVLVAGALLVRVRPPVTPRLGAATVGAAALGLGIASIELFPALELLQGTRRLAGFGYDEAKRWPMTGARFVELFVPTFWAPPQAHFVSFPVIYDGEPLPPHLRSFYFGIASSVALAGLTAARNQRWVLVFAGAALFGLMVATGDGTPLHRGLTHLPLLSSARFPTKYLCFTVAGVAALVPFGLEVTRKSPERLGLILLVQLIGLGVGYSVVVSPELLEWVGRNISRNPAMFTVAGFGVEEHASTAVAFMQKRLLHACGFVSVAGVVVHATTHFEALKAHLPLVLLALLVLDLGVAGRYAIPGAATFPANPPADVLSQIDPDVDRIYAVSPDGRPLKLPHVEGRTYYEEEIVSRRARGTLAYDGIRRLEDRDMDAQSHPASVLAFRLLQVLQGDAGLRLLGRAGVRWLTSWSSLGSKDVVRWDVPGEAPQFLVPVPNHRRYVEAHPTWQAVELSQLSLREQADLYTNPARLDTAILLTPGVAGSTLTADRAAACRARQTVKLVSTEIERIEVRVRSECRTLVTALETVQARWTVTVDGTSAALLAAEFGSLAVEVPKGEHTVVFEYKPATARWAPVAAGSLLLCMLGVLIPRRRRS